MLPGSFSSPAFYLRYTFSPRRLAGIVCFSKVFAMASSPAPPRTAQAYHRPFRPRALRRSIHQRCIDAHRLIYRLNTIRWPTSTAEFHDYFRSGYISRAHASPYQRLSSSFYTSRLSPRAVNIILIDHSHEKFGIIGMPSRACYFTQSRTNIYRSFQ